MNSMIKFNGKLALQQRVLPGYRVPFFTELSRRCAGGLSVFAGEPLSNEGIHTADEIPGANFTRTENQHLLSGAFYLCRQRELMEWLKAQNADVLVASANPRYLSNPKAIRWMRAQGRPVLGWGLGAPPLQGPLSGFRNQGRVKMLKLLDGMIAYSARGAAEYRALGVPPERVFVAYNAVVPRPKSMPERSKEIQGRSTIIFVGRLQPRKGLDVLFKAGAQLPDAIKPDMLIVGDGPARAEFESLAASLYPRSEFVGAQHGKALDELFKQADLFVLPGTGGLAIQQAMSHALPVIVAQGDGTQDDLVRPENGWLVQPWDVDDLRKALLEALEDGDRLRQMGAASFRIAQKEINLEAMADAFAHAMGTIQELGPRTVE
jgi:glycosyltransferase involved in cell wall biosynthesis